MSKYNKTVLTQAGLDLAKRANAGQAKFKVTRAVTSADDLGNTPVQQLERMTEVPNIMQEGKILDAEEVESDNAVIGVSLRFTNEGLTTGYKIRIIGLYVQEDGQTNDFLYAVTTAVEPEYMPDYNDNVLYRFNTQLYLVIGRAQNVTVVVDDKTVVSVKKFNDFKEEVDKKIEQAGKVKKARVNEGTIVEPDDQGILNLFVDGARIQDFPAEITDLNSLTKSGFYRCSNLSISDTNKIANTPVQGPNFNKGYIKVINDSNKKNITQLQFTVMGAHSVYMRTSLSGGSSFNNWTKLSPSNDLTSADITNLIQNKINDLGINQYATKKELNDVNNSSVKEVNGVAPDSNGNVGVTSTVARGFDYTANTASKMTTENLYQRNQILLDQNAGQDIVRGVKDEINTKNKATITTGYNWDTGAATTETRSLQDTWLVDQVVLNGAVTRINQNRDNANGRLSLQGGTMAGTAQIKFADSGSWNATGDAHNPKGKRGGLRWDGQSDWAEIYADESGSDNLDLVIQLGDDGSNGVIIRNASGNQVAKVDAAGNITSPTITALLKKITDLKNRLGEDEGRITHIENNYVEGRRFPASQEAQAQAWENEKPTRLAMIEK